MSASPRLLRWSLGLAVVVVVVAGFVIGMRLGAVVSEPGVAELRFVDPRVLDSVPSSTVRSAGGFTGFGGAPALTGGVLRSGQLAGIEPGRITVEGPSATLEVSHDGGTRLFRLAAATSDLAPGDRVVLRTESGQVAGVLRVVE